MKLSLANIKIKTEKKAFFSGVIHIALIFFFFLIFAQFAFIKHLKNLIPETDLWLKGVMGCMGLGGLLMSLITFRLIRKIGRNRAMIIAYAGCFSVAGLTPCMQNRLVLLLLALLTGLTMAILTVTVAGSLDLWFGNRKVGLGAGLGTGFAYASASFPTLFHASTAQQCFLAAFSALAGLVVVLLDTGILREDGKDGGEPVLERHRLQFRINPVKAFSFYIILAGFLVMLDSAAFYIMQNVDLQQATHWNQAIRQGFVCTAHFLAALLAGLALDRGSAPWIGLAASLLLIGGMLTLGQEAISSSKGISAAVAYAAGVSLYSTLLVTLPVFSESGQSNGLKKRSSREDTICKKAGILFGLAGWIASGLGIGMATDLGYVPVPFWIAVALVTLLPVLSKTRKEINMS